MVAKKLTNDGPVELYLDLLKKALTNTIYTAEPSEDSKSAFVRGFIDHYIQGSAVSMLPLARLDNLQACIDDVLKSGVPGDLIETGVWRGGATIFMRAMLKARGVTDRPSGSPIPLKVCRSPTPRNSRSKPKHTAAR